MQRSHTVWTAAHGDGPWPCSRCGSPVRGFSDGDGIVHHEDRNHDNNDPANLHAMHHACHVAEHQRLAHRELASLIIDGNPPGRLPSIKELATAHGVAPMTVRRAVALLASEGAVRIMHGRGTFIVAPRG